MSEWLKTLWQWITGPDIFLEVAQCPDSEVVNECIRRIPWLTDRQLGGLIDAAEVEQINRLARLEGAE